MGNWTDWANDVVWVDTLRYECECGFNGDVEVECEGNGRRWTALVECPECGVEEWKGDN